MTCSTKNIPILCLDTCSILDILRNPTRKDVCVKHQGASLVLLQAAEEKRLKVLVADRVVKEFFKNVKRVEEETINTISALQRDIRKLDQLTTLHGSSGQVDSIHWNDYAMRCRGITDRWLKAGTIIPQSDQILTKAALRAIEPRSPAKKGKDSTSDCVILETYLKCIQDLRGSMNTMKIVFVSSNVRDYAKTNKMAVQDDIVGEFESLKLNYAPNMEVAKYLLGV